MIYYDNPNEMEDIEDIWDAFERNKVEVAVLIRQALKLRERTKNPDVLIQVERFLVATGWE